MTRKPAAPDHRVRGVAHDYWIQQRRLRGKRQAASDKQQAKYLTGRVRYGIK